MSFDFKQLREQIQEDLSAVKNAAELELARVRHLGRKSELSEFLRTLKDKAEDERRRIGSEANALRQELEQLFEEQRAKLSLQARSLLGKIDISAPGTRVPSGHVHILTQAQDAINEIFVALGFRVLEGPELETGFNNFDALNIPADHPARDAMDTFWLADSAHLLRTHTSPMQVRFMQQHEPPFRIVVPGRVFRNEATDATHEFQFHQIEGLMVGPRHSADGTSPVSLAHLKGVMEFFYRRFFRDDVTVKFVASYFPFVEPGVEVYIRGTKGKLAGRWIEVAGAGMVHPNVFKAAGYVPEQWQGFAFGMALERMVMLKYGVDDIRVFQSGDLRFSEQF